MGLPPTRIEVISAIDGVEFDECYANRELFEHDGIEITVIGFEDLLVNKKASGRPIDLADLSDLGGE